MINKYIIILIIGSLPITSYGNQDISDKIDTASAALELLNDYGLRCDVQLQLSGLKGAITKDCKLFRKNISGGLSTIAQTACNDLQTWLNSNVPTNEKDKEQFARTNARKLIRIKRACDMNRYIYIKKTVRKITLLAEAYAADTQ